jgi:SAM-dependent methyltransferase
MPQLHRNALPFRLLVNVIIVCFLLSFISPVRAGVQAPSDLGIPKPGVMVSLTPAYVPVLVKGLRIHPENPILFDFIVDTGNSGMTTRDSRLKSESEKLIKYFLASLTIPEDDLWVNLSPYEKNRVVPQSLGQTEMGRDMLAEDYILKQLTASLIYPEKDLGKEFWEKVYAKARRFYGTTQIPVNTFNKVWIVADRAKVYVHDNTAYVVGSHLKVMLEQDYLSLGKHRAMTELPAAQGSGVAAVGADIVRQIVLPELEKEVNLGKNFANLRQIFHSMILASWYKKNFKEALLNQVYSDKAKIKGVNLQDTTIKEQIYQQYLQAYRKGVFNYIKEDVQADGRTISRKYFSGGVLGVKQFDLAQTSNPADRDAATFIKHGPDGLMYVVRVATPSDSDKAQTADNGKIERLYPEAVIEAGDEAKIYGDKVARSNWYKENIGFDIKPLVEEIAASKNRASELEIVDASAGTGIASETLLEELRKKNLTIKKLTLVDIDTRLSRDYMNYAIKQLEGKYKDVVGEIDFYILGKQADGSFAPLSDIEGLKADYVLMENALHVVPPVSREKTLQSLKEIMKPGAKLLIGSGSVESSESKQNGAVYIDSLFGLVREGVLKIIKEDPKYTKLKDIVEKADGVKINKLLQAVFPEKPTKDEILSIGQKIGLNMRFDTVIHDLEREDYRFFITGIEGYVNSAILPELGIPLLQRQLKDLHTDERTALLNQINHLVELRNELITRVYNELYDAHQGHFQVTWTQILADSPDKAMTHGKVLQTPRLEKVRGAQVFSDTKGGIDLNSRNMLMDVSGEKINIKFDQALVDQFRRGDFSGIRPVIINITPVPNGWPSLGVISALPSADPVKAQEHLAGV